MMDNIENYFGALILILFCFLISRWEKTKQGTTITPFGVLAWPYAVVVALVNVGGIHFGFFPVNMRSIIFVLVCLLFFIFGGAIINLIFENQVKTKSFIDNQIKQVELFDFYRPLFIGLAIISVVSGSIHLYLTIKKLSWFSIASQEFHEIYNKGVLSHIMKLSRPAFIFLLADYMSRKRKMVFLLLTLIFLSILVSQIKNNIITILLGGFLFAYMYNLMKINFKKILIYASFIYILFNVSYAIGFSRIGVAEAYSSKVQLYLFNLFFTYLFGGPIGFSEILSNAFYPLYSTKEVFAVPINLYNSLYANPNLIDTIIHNWIPVSNIHAYFHTSNVFGIFGMLYIFIGSYATFIYMFLLGLIAYIFKLLAYKENTFIGFQLIYVYLMSFLTISFFGLYFNLLPIYEVSFFMVIIPFVYSAFRRFVMFRKRMGLYGYD